MPGVGAEARQGSTVPESTNPTVRMSVHNDTSRPLREAGAPSRRAMPAAPAASSASGARPRALLAGDVPPPLQSFEGVSNQDNEAVHGFPFLPPDPTGEAGPNHYVQAVNRSIGVFSKTGVMAPGFPKRLRDVWAGFGGVCETQTRGDPILLYDQLADRWTVSQFAEENGFRGPFL
ncbi:MAG: hypothetical protein LC733_03515, partial [Actinobacteria bacterium]|nr:hypothetical protein [Actinomycetota bacterium]